MNAEPWLCLGGIELGNAMRTLAYLANGLGGSRFEVLTRTVGGAGGDSYFDIYTDQYLSTGVRQVPSCGCDAIDDGPYVDPANDDAPWWTGGRSESSSFLGFYPSSITTRPTLARSMAQGQLGGSLAAPGAGGQVAVVSGVLYAATAAGMAYGERWLTAAVAGELCDDDPELVILPACPEEGRPAEWRTLLHVGLVDEIVFAPIDSSIPGCLLQRATFQLGAECPWLLRDPIVFADNYAVLNGFPSRWWFETDEWPGDAGLRMTVDAGGGDLTNVRLYAQLSADGTCPPTGTVQTCFDFTVPLLPQGQRLTVDAIDRLAVIESPASGLISGGLDRFSFAPPWRFPDVAACSGVCITFFANGAGGVLNLELVGREL